MEKKALRQKFCFSDVATKVPKIKRQNYLVKKIIKMSLLVSVRTNRVRHCDEFMSTGQFELQCVGTKPKALP